MGERWNSFPTLEKDEHEWTTLTQWWQVHVSSVQQLTLSLTLGLVGGPFPESEQRLSPWPNHSTTFWLTRGCQLGPIVIEVGRKFLPSSLTLEGTSSLLFWGCGGEAGHSPILCPLSALHSDCVCPWAHILKIGNTLIPPIHTSIRNITK